MEMFVFIVSVAVTAERVLQLVIYDETDYISVKK